MFKISKKWSLLLILSISILFVYCEDENPTNTNPLNTTSLLGNWELKYQKNVKQYTYTNSGLNFFPRDTTIRHQGVTDNDIFFFQITENAITYFEYDPTCYYKEILGNWNGVLVGEELGGDFKGTEPIPITTVGSGTGTKLWNTRVSMDEGQLIIVEHKWFKDENEKIYLDEVNTRYLTKYSGRIPKASPSAICVPVD